MKTKKTNSKKAAKVEKTNSKKTTKAPKLDRFGFEVDSNQGVVNAALSAKRAMTVRELADKTGLDHRRCRYQCRVLARAKLAKRVRSEEGLAYRLAK